MTVHGHKEQKGVKKMADKENEVMEDEDEVIVTFVDEDGNEEYYIEEMILEVNGEKFALLVPTCDDEEAEAEHEHHDGCCCEDEADEAFFAKIIINDKGEEEYVMPSDEEFDAACQAYDKLMDEEE